MERESTQAAEGAQQTNNRAASARIQDALDQMHAKRRSFERARQAGLLNQRERLRFQASIVDVFEELHPFRNEVEEKWKGAGPWDDGVEKLPANVGTREVTERKQKGFGRTVLETREEPVLLPDVVMVKLSYQLDEIATELGMNLNPYGGEIDAESDEPY